MKKMLFLLLLLGCEPVVRDPVVYLTEVDQYHLWATKQAALLRGFLKTQCLCDEAQVTFTTQECREAADYILTVESRAEWHRNMSLFLGGLMDQRPSDLPPAIPASSTLCTGGVK